MAFAQDLPGAAAVAAFTFGQRRTVTQETGGVLGQRVGMPGDDVSHGSRPLLGGIPLASVTEIGPGLVRSRATTDLIDRVRVRGGAAGQVRSRTPGLTEVGVRVGR